MSFILGLLVGGVALSGYLYLVGGAGTPSSVISAPTLAVEDNAHNQVSLFRIVPDASQATFSVLDNGEYVEGVTNQVAGDMRIDFVNPQNSELGTMRVNLRTLETGVAGRNRALRADVLLSGQDAYEFGIFEPLTFGTAPDSITFNTPYTFEVNGNLTLRGVTQPAVFAVEIILENSTRLTGQAITTVSREAYSIGSRLPDYISDDVTLSIDLVAVVVAEESEATPEAES